MANNNLLIQPYLFFEGRCEEAIEFYKRALGAEVGMLMRYKDCPEPPPGMAPGSENKVMHAQVTIGQNVLLMSDGRCSGKLGFGGFSLSITLPTEAEIERRFKALSEGGKVGMPLSKTFFAARFGMLEDKFGVGWMMIVRPES
ncbi:MAG TPA: VOC family protein [Candidatus Sulfotelmatobacter sp.]|nr:VOC family protein [Candidatus Sulfotelmatobacter sp.]